MLLSFVTLTKNPKFMKKLLFLLILFCALKTNGQNYLIIFEGSGASSSVSTVKVENLKTGTSLILNGSDVLRLNFTTDVISSETDQSSLLKLYPNPASDNVTLEIFPPVAGDFIISVLDVSGKPLTHYQGNSYKSGQSFHLSGLKNGIYFINVKGLNYNLSGKLISNGKTNDKINIEKISNLIQGDESKKTGSENKGTMATIDMAYTSGERLKFTGISGNYSTVRTAIPTANTRISFNFIACTDDDGNNYPVVPIGTQTWMGENLRTTKFTDHSGIANVTDHVAWYELTTPAYCWYNNDIANKSVYGALYNFYSVNSNKLCPAGWHVPSDNDWTVLTDYLGGLTIVGDKLKETGNAHWSSIFNSATNETGFTALPGGTRYIYENGGLIFEYINTTAIFWSGTMPYTRSVYGEKADVFRGAFSSSKFGFSVRCIKD
jgi:uncharacterized protein (TIGR02145 family)